MGGSHFGPKLEVHDPFDVARVEEAVTLANRNAYGLYAGIITRDAELGMAIARRLESGIVHSNVQTVHDEPQTPFGGTKDSGWGRFGGRAAVEELPELRWITHPGRGAALPILTVTFAGR